jgi:protein TonB
MRKIFLLGVIICATLSYAKAQDTLISYFDKDWEVVSKKKKAQFYRKEFYDNDKKIWAVNDYYISGQIQMTGFYETQKKDVKHGLFTYYSKLGLVESQQNFMRGSHHGMSKRWYKDGTPHEFINYKYGKYHGEFTTFWKNGQMRRKDFYEKDSLISGTVWDSLGVEADYCNYMVMPEFPGGQEALFRFISKNVRYPENAKYWNKQGEVIVQFVVGKDGSISNVSVLKSVHRLLDNEAIRIIKALPKWTPGFQDGIPVFVRYQLPIRFRLGR